ncbi:Transcriptional regulator [Gaertneriomyces sp. JEL0708]|nr:Transcriptional regulator [Gaertneriomyces sp. JEL0708]
MTTHEPPKARISSPPLDCAELPVIKVEDYSTLDILLEHLSKAASSESSPSEPRSPKQLPFHLSTSALPPLPSLDDLQLLQSELLALDRTARSRKSQLQKNVDVLKEFLPTADKGKDIPKTKDTKSDHDRKKDARDSRRDSLRDDAKEKSTPKIKLKLGHIKTERNADESSLASTPIDSPIAELPDLTKKRKRERDADDTSDVDRDKRASIGPASNSTPKPPPPLRQSSAQEKVAGQPRGVPPKSKPRVSKKSGSQKNNKWRKRASIADSEDHQQTPEPEDKPPAVPVDGDYTNAKPVQNQIPIQQFWGFVDQFFRPLTEDDLKFLDVHGDEVTPYVIPPLGRPYKEQWAEEHERAMQLDHEPQTVPAAIGQEYAEVNGAVHHGDICIKPLSERIIASLVESRHSGPFTLPGPSVPEADMNGVHYEDVHFRTDEDMNELEERMRNELRHLGLLDDEAPGLGQNEEDEVTKELRKLQGQLREQVATNKIRKAQLKEVAEKWMAWQEYNSVLSDLNKNIEQAYNKRFRTPAKSKGKKKVSKPDQRGAVGENVMGCLLNRQRIIDEVGAFFTHESFRMPERSIYSL